MENKSENEINEEFYNIEKDNDNEFCLLEENKQKNKIEAKNQISKISNNCSKNVPFIKTNSYVKSNGKLTISLNKNEKKELADKYWIIKPEKKFDFYGKEIKTLYKNDKIAGLKDLIGILMVFKKFLSNNEIKRFDKYFSILIKSHERNYKTEKADILMLNNIKKEEKNGKILYIGGNLNVNLGFMFQNEFNDFDNKNMPIYISIMIYKEYEEIEIDALDYCDTIPEHNGFNKYKNVFHQDFSKNLSNKVNRIKRDRNKKREDLLKK